MSYSYKCKIKKWTTESQKFENLRTTHKFYVDLSPKRYLGQEILLLEVWVMGLGSKLKVLISHKWVYTVLHCLYLCTLLFCISVLDCTILLDIPWLYICIITVCTALFYLEGSHLLLDLSHVEVERLVNLSSLRL